MEDMHVRNWEEFEERLRDLRDRSNRPNYLLYRGHSDSSWSLQTTLERRLGYTPAVMDYYRIVDEIKLQTETFTGLGWDEVRYEESSELSRELAFGKLPAYSYLAYLRHHGFPSPLLDWSSSPYVAAYFAFHAAGPADRAVYVYAEMDAGAKIRSGKQPEIYSFGPNVKTHRRHFLQQSQYTVCVKLHQDIPKDEKEWRFAQHDHVFQRNTGGQDVLTKFVIPWSERIKVLKRLEEYNLNALSLFGSEESLLETLAIRQFDFRAAVATQHSDDFENAAR
jgi:hypothetical protein